MLLPMSPTSSLFLIAESRENPMHVGSLQLYRPPEGADALDVRAMFEKAIVADEVAPLFLKRPRRSITTLGQWGWETDREFDLEHHVRRSALPRPGRILDLLALCSRLHSTLLDRHRPMWEMHLIEGLEDGRYAIVLQGPPLARRRGVGDADDLEDRSASDPDRAATCRRPGPRASTQAEARSATPPASPAPDAVAAAG